MTAYTKECEIANNFCIEGDIVKITPHGEGHINKTFLIETTLKKYIFQGINTNVFKNPAGVMSNIRLVTKHLKKNGKATLSVIKRKDGTLVYEDEGGVFRMYDFIGDSVVYQSIENPQLFENAGRAFGDFQNSLASFDASLLTETIEHFHDTPDRYRKFLLALSQNKSGRAHLCKAETEFLQSREHTFDKIVNAIASADVPLRVTHNDTKLNNVMFDKNTGDVKAVIDLDTVMPGSMLYDFGDAIRFGANTAAEDEQDLSKVRFDISLYEAFARGFCTAVKETMTKRERELLAYSAYLITMECGMRFLTDFIDGDTYFGTKYPEHNLVRCRTQFELARQMEENMPLMESIAEKYSK